jgi:hypothetical protein
VITGSTVESRKTKRETEKLDCDTKTKVGGNEIQYTAHEKITIGASLWEGVGTAGYRGEY